MAPVLQIFILIFLFSFGLMAPESVFAVPYIPIHSSVLTGTVIMLGGTVIASFIFSRMIIWTLKQ